MKRKFLTIKEVSEITGLSIHTIRNRVDKGVFRILPRSKNEKILIYYDSIFAEEELKQTE